MSMPFAAIAASISFAMIPFGLQVSSETDAGNDAPPVESTAQTGSDAQASAQSPQIISGEAQDTLLKEIALALGNVETARGRFSQAGADGSQTEGKFFLRRPGRVRFEYDDPSPLLIVADGTTVAIEDRDLETQDRVPLRATPLAMILDDEINFEDEVDVLQVRQGNGVIIVIMQDRSGETEGTLALVVDAEDYGLLQWQTEDVAGGVTSVQLSAIETGVRINPRLFRIEELGEEDERD